MRIVLLRYMRKLLWQRRYEIEFTYCKELDTWFMLVTWRMPWYFHFHRHLHRMSTFLFSVSFTSEDSLLSALYGGGWLRVAQYELVHRISACLRM